MHKIFRPHCSVHCIDLIELSNTADPDEEGHGLLWLGSNVEDCFTWVEPCSAVCSWPVKRIEAGYDDNKDQRKSITGPDQGELRGKSTSDHAKDRIWNQEGNEITRIGSTLPSSLRKHAWVIEISKTKRKRHSPGYTTNPTKHRTHKS